MDLVNLVNCILFRTYCIFIIFLLLPVLSGPGNLQSLLPSLVGNFDVLRVLTWRSHNKLKCVLTHRYHDVDNSSVGVLMSNKCGIRSNIDMKLHIQSLTSESLTYDQYDMKPLCVPLLAGKKMSLFMLMEFPFDKIGFQRLLIKRHYYFSMSIILVKFLVKWWFIFRRDISSFFCFPPSQDTNV